MTAEDFIDPLQDFEPKTYADNIQAALAEQDVMSIQHAPFATISHEQSVEEGVRQLAEMNVGCLLVVDDGKLVGVFSDRDVLDKASLEYDDVKDKPVSEVMTPNPVYVYETDAAASALCVMAVNRHRHVPILDLNENVVGIIGPYRVTSFLMEKHAQSG